MKPNEVKLYVGTYLVDGIGSVVVVVLEQFNAVEEGVVVGGENDVDIGLSGRGREGGSPFMYGAYICDEETFNVAWGSE